MTPRVRAVIAALEAGELLAAADMLATEIEIHRGAAVECSIDAEDAAGDALWQRRDRALELAAAGVSQREIARRLGVPRSTVQGWMGGRRVADSAGFRPDSATLGRPDSATSATPSATLGGEGGDLSSLGSSPDSLLSISSEPLSFSSSLIPGSSLEERARDEGTKVEPVAEGVAEVADSAGRPATPRPAESGHHARAKATRATKTLIPAGWQPTPAFWSWVDRERYDVADVRRELGVLSDWASSNGRRMADWDACARNWVRRSAADGKVDRVERAEPPLAALPPSLRNLSPAELEERRSATRARLAEHAKTLGGLFDDPEPTPEATP